MFIDDFLLTHRVFTTSAILFEKLLARYNIQPTAVSSPDDKKKKDKPKEEKEVDKAAGELDNNTVALIRARYVVSFFLGGEGWGVGLVPNIHLHH